MLKLVEGDYLLTVGGTKVRKVGHLWGSHERSRWAKGLVLRRTLESLNDMRRYINSDRSARVEW